MPRTARIVAQGYPHHIVQRGNNKQDVFFDDQDRLFYLNLLKKYSKDCASKVHAYCLMRNHVHILVTPERDDSLAKTMQKLSLTFTQHINKKYGRTGRLWECRFHSTLVDKDNYLWAVCRYIERNPVRAKIVDVPSTYEWSSASRARRSDVLDRAWIQDDKQKQEYIDFLNIAEDKSQTNLIRKNTYNGRPIGSAGFIKHMAELLKVDLNIKPKGRPRKDK